MKESSFSNQSHVLEELGSGELGLNRRLQAPLVVHTSVGVRRNALCGFAWASVLRSGMLSSSCLAAGCSGSAQMRRFGRGTGACAAQVVNQVSPTSSCPPWRHRLFHCLQWLRVWCYRRPEVPVELEWRSRTTRHDKTCCLGPLSLSLRLAHLSRHSVVAPNLAAPLLTDTRRSAVGSGTREDIVTMPDEMRVHDAVHVREFQWARHVRGDPDWCRRRACGVRVHPLDAGCTAHRDAGNDGVVHRKDATRFAKRVMKSVAKAINDAAVVCSRGVAASRLF